MLVDSSVRFNFSILNLHITADQLKGDGMHVHSNYRSWVCNAITAHCTTTLDTHRTLTQFRHRSRAALTRRNNKRHKRSEHQRKAYSVTRPIDRSWKLQHIKVFLKQREIKYSRLPEIYHHRLRIFFNSADAQQYADQILAPDNFNERNYQECYPSNNFEPFSSSFLLLFLGELFAIGIFRFSFLCLFFLFVVFIFRFTCEPRYDCSISFSERRSRCPAQSFSGGRGRC